MERDEHIFFTADLHLGHANVIKYTDRPWESVDDMDEVLIANWNAIVGPHDTVYHIGDFTLQGRAQAHGYLERLNGKIHMLEGSHDQRWFGVEAQSCSGRPVIYEPPLLTLEFKDLKSQSATSKTGHDGKYPLSITLCHYAMEKWPKSHYGALHLFGHSHGRLEAGPQRMDVGVDAVEGYQPISLLEAKERLCSG